MERVIMTHFGCKNYYSALSLTHQQMKKQFPCSLPLLMLMSQPESGSRHFPFESKGLSLDSFQG